MTTSTDPFPPRAASQMHSFIRLRLYCFSRPALFSKEPLRQRGYGGIVGERDNQLKILLLYVLDKASILLSTASALVNFKPNSSTSCLIAANTISNSITFSSVSRFRFRSHIPRGCGSGCESEEEDAELIVMGGEDFLGLRLLIAGIESNVLSSLNASAFVATSEMHRRLREIDLLPFDRFLSEEGVAFVWESWLARALRTSLLLTVRQTSKAQLLTVGGQEDYC